MRIRTTNSIAGITHRILAIAALMGLSCATPVVALAQASITPAYLDELESRKLTVTLSNGLVMAYLDIGRRDAPALVLIHGYTDSARDWAPLAPLLADRFRLLIPDLRGHGASAKPECCYSRFDFAYDIKLLLDTVHIRDASVAGHSLGSLVAQTFAELWPSHVKRLILISSTGTSFGGVPGWLADVAQLEDPIDPDSQFMRSWWKTSISINPQFFSSRQRHDAAAIPAAVWRAIADQSLIGVDLASMLPRIQAPVLLIWGGRDTLVGTAGRQALRAGLSRAEVQTFPSLGHDLFWEDPQAVAAAMNGFLQKQ
jgi:pimeloyl-ACP methyl ester carboxylesterase